jgi:hypothetical protein
MNNTPAPFLAVDVNWNRFAEPALLLADAAGSATITLGPNFPVDGDTKTGLVGATTYTATVNIDGTDRAVSILGSAAQTITTLLAELVTDLGTWATVELVGDAIVITSLTTGPNSVVFISDTGTNFLFASIIGAPLVAGQTSPHYGVTNYDSTQGWFTIAGSLNRVGTSVKGHNKYARFDKMDTTHQEHLMAVVAEFLTGQASAAVSGYQVVNVGGAKVGGSATGLANTAQVYTASVVVDGGASQPIAVTGSTAQTYTTLLAELNTNTTGATWALVGGNLRCTSDSVGANSSVAITNVDLFSTLTNFVAILAAVAGTDGDNTNQAWVNAVASIAITTGAPTLGSDTLLDPDTVYELDVNVNGAGDVRVSIDLDINQVNDTSFETLLEAINIGLGNAVQADGSPLPVVAEWYEGHNATIQPHIVFRVLTSNTPFTSTASGAVLQGSTTSLVLTDVAVTGIVAALDDTTYAASPDTAQQGYGVVSFNRVNAAVVAPATVPAVPAGNYDFTVNVEDTGVRVSYNVTVAVLVTDAMSDIATSMQAALQTATGEAELVAAVDNKFLISNETAGTGFNTQVEVVMPTAGANPDLFNAIAAALDVVDPRGDTGVSTYSVDGFATPGVDGATNVVFPKTVDGISYDNWEEVLASAPIGGRVSTQFLHGLTGFGPLFTSGSGVVFEKENRPAVRGQCVDNQQYWDGAAWRYFVDGDTSRINTDDTSAGTNNPPETLDRGV